MRQVGRSCVQIQPQLNGDPDFPESRPGLHVHAEFNDSVN